MDEGDRRAPIALARDAPVAQAPHRRALAPAFMLGAGDDGRLGLVDVHAVQEMTVHKAAGADIRSEEHTSELQSLMRISYAVFCLKKKKTHKRTHRTQCTNHNTKHNRK